MPSPNELVALLARANESLSVEHKSWLCLSERSNQAKLAKAAIALANHGGGTIVLGMRPLNEDSGRLQSQPRPDHISRFNQDQVNAAINYYADPGFHCDLEFALHPDTGVEHAFIIVPPGIGVPVMTKRDCEGEFRKWRCFIRKPNPRSEEPQNGEEWRTLFDKCIRARREDLLDAIRAIVQGHVPITLKTETIDTLLQFADAAKQRWLELTASLPPDDDARMPFGRYEMSVQFQDAEPLPSLAALRDAMTIAERVRYTGWGAFVTLDRPPYEPIPVGDGIQTWLGAHEENRTLRGPAHCDFWAAHPAGRFLLIRGFTEDEGHDVPPGEMLSVSLPIWRVGEVLLFFARLAPYFGDSTKIIVRCKYFGLQGRELGELRSQRFLRRSYICQDSEVLLETVATPSQLTDNLAEVLHDMLRPLYERFSFFELSMDIVQREVGRLRRGRF